MKPLYVKFAYKTTNKKIQMTKEQLTWDNICDILMKSFLMAEKEKIMLKYKDQEDDEITVSCDQDLAEAYNLYFMKNLIKFFVYYSGAFDKDINLNATGYSKVERPLSLTSLSPKNIELEKSLKVSPINSVALEKNLRNSQILSEPKVSKVKIETQDLISILNEVFESPEVLQKIQAKLSNYILKDNNETVEYSIDTDHKAITDYMIANLNTLLNKKVEQKPIEEIIKEIPTIQLQIEEPQIDFTNDRLTKTDIFKANSILEDAPLERSIYERSANWDLTNSMGRSPMNSTLRKSMDCKDLSSSMGVKLVLKQENGKAKLVSIPISEYSILETSVKEEIPKASIREEIFETIIQEEVLESSINGEAFETIIKEEVDVIQIKKPSNGLNNEFTKKILNANMHDLDRDLPAPYDIKRVQKFGFDISIYEKIY